MYTSESLLLNFLNSSQRKWGITVIPKEGIKFLLLYFLIKLKIDLFELLGLYITMSTSFHCIMNYIIILSRLKLSLIYL